MRLFRHRRRVSREILVCPISCEWLPRVKNTQHREEQTREKDARIASSLLKQPMCATIMGCCHQQECEDLSSSFSRVCSSRCCFKSELAIRASHANVEGLKQVAEFVQGQRPVRPSAVCRKERTALWAVFVQRETPENTLDYPAVATKSRNT